MKISAVILNWKRPDNVRRIVDGWRESGIVDDAIVWNNNAAEPFSHDWATVINANRDCGLYTRFNAALLAKNQVMLIQDDDLLLSTDQLAQLVKAHENRSWVLHGIYGRGPKADGTYCECIRARDGETREVPIVLTRCLVTWREAAAEFFRDCHRFDALQAGSKPYGNGEDIIFSYTLRRLNGGRLHKVHDIQAEELPAPHAIHARGGWGPHVEHRTRIMQACEAWLREGNK